MARAYWRDASTAQLISLLANHVETARLVTGAVLVYVRNVCFDENGVAGLNGAALRPLADERSSVPRNHPVLVGLDDQEV